MSPNLKPTTAQRGRPRDEKAKIAILTAAATLVRDRGYESVTVEGIAAEARVGKQTIYRWWPTKAAVVGDAFVEGFVAFPQTELAYTADVWTDLDNWIRTNDVGFDGGYGDLLRIAAAVAAADKSAGGRLIEHFAQPFRALLARRLENAVAEGQITPDLNLDAVVDILQAVVTYAGLTHADKSVLPNTLAIIRLAARRQM